MSIKLDRIATELIEKKLINESQAQTCMSEAQKEKKDFFNILLIFFAYYNIKLLLIKMTLNIIYR